MRARWEGQILFLYCTKMKRSSQHYLYVGEGSGYEDYYYNWTYTLGGSFRGDNVLFNGGEDDHNINWNDPLPAGVGAFSTIAQNGLMTGTLNNITYYISYLLGIYGPYEFQAQTETMIEPSGQQAVGGTALYLVEASAMSYTNVDDAVNFSSGEVPVPPEKLAVNGQELVNSGVSNADGSVWGMTFISAPAGATVKLITTGPAGLYSPTNQAQEVTVQSLTVVSNSATQIDSNDWAVVKSNATNDYVIVQAALSITNAAVQTQAGNLIQWSGGEVVSGNPLQRRVSKATSAETTVTASLGSTNVSLNVWVIWATISYAVSNENPSPLTFPPIKLGVIYWGYKLIAVVTMLAEKYA